jgi:hypothetical protein
MQRDRAERKQLLDTRARSWRGSALARGLTRRVVRRARIEVLVLLSVLAGVLLVYRNRAQLLGPEWDTADPDTSPRRPAPRERGAGGRDVGNDQAHRRP